MHERTAREAIREIKDEANVRAGNDPETYFVVAAKTAAAVIGEISGVDPDTV